MKAVIEFFKKQWVIQLLGVLALSVLLWFIGPLLAISGHAPLEQESIRALVILLLGLLWALNTLYRQIKIRRANAKLADDLTENANLELAQAAHAEISTLAQHFDEAVKTLKKDAKNTQGKNFLYDLPWYIIIGPPGSGKTTALVNSGLEFPLADKFGKGAVRGVGGTRNCDWWFTDQAVLLDTAGRYVTQDSHEAVDKAAWLGFLNLLKKHRPRRPVNGVLVSMSLSDLIKQTEEERNLHAQAIRRRIEELHSHFGIRFPIYMLFTKSDLIAGFDDFFATLNKDERTQVWGVTFPEEDPGQPIDIMTCVGRDFDDLLLRINAQLPKRLQEERDLQRRNRIFGFPQRMALLREGLLDFLQGCYGGNRFQEAPYLRGVYFTSATQEGTPIDRLMGMLAQSFKLDRTAVPLLSGKGKSYFITRLLKDVIFEEALIVGVNRRLERLNTLWRQGIYAAASALIVMMSALWLTSYAKNQTTLGTTQKLLQQADTVIKTTPNAQNDVSELLKRLEAMQAVTQAYPDDVPGLMTFGLYQGGKLKPVIQETYSDLLQKQFLPLIKSRLEQRMADAMDKPDQLYALLEVYLMLGDGKRLKPELLKSWVGVDWETIYANDTDTQSKLLAHLDALLKQPLQTPALDERLIAAARQVLNRIPVAQQVYMHIKNEALQSKDQDYKWLEGLGSNADRVFIAKKGTLPQQTIPYLFTYDGFYKTFLKQSKKAAQDSITGSWVLGEAASPATADNGALEDAIRSYYYQDYIQYWDTVLANTKIKASNNAQQASDVLGFISAPDSPLRKLLETLNKQTALTNTPPSPIAVVKQLAGAEKPLDERNAKLLAVAKSEGLAGQSDKPLGIEVETHFLPLTSLVRGTGKDAPINRTMDTLAQLYGYMIDLGGTSAPGAVAIKKVAGSNGADPVARMKAQAEHLPEPLKSMLLNLAAGNQTVILDSGKSQLSSVWQTEIMPLYVAGIQGRYPFSASSNKEVTLEDFGRFFAPGGLLDTFFNNNLKPLVDTSAKPWRMIKHNNQALAISGTALAQLQTASKIRQLFFAGGGAMPSVKFNLKPLSLDARASAFWLTLEGQTSKYTPSEAGVSAAFTWPGPDGSRLVSFGFDTLDGKKLHKDIEGQWAWFRVLALAHIQKIDPAKYVLTFEIDGLQARYELSASSVDNPFTPGQFSTVHFPTRL